MQKADSLEKQISTEQDYENTIHLLIQLTNIYEYQGKWALYDRAAKKILQLSEEEQDSITLARAYNKLGISCCYQGQNKEALQYFKQMLGINLRHKEYSSAAHAYENIGLAYKEIGDYENSISYQIKALEIREEHNHPRIFNTNIEIADLYGIVGNQEKQIEYFDHARKALNKSKNFDAGDYAIYYNQLGDIYSDQAMYDSCVMCYKNVIYYSRLANWKIGIAVGLGNLAETYYETGYLDSSIIMHKQALKLSLEIDDCMSIAEEYLYLARLYLETDQHDSILSYAENALKRAEECDLMNEQGSVLEFLAAYYENIKNYELAYLYTKKDQEIHDSIFSIDIKNNMVEMETKFQTKLKEQQIELLTNENQIINQRIALFIAISVLLLLLIFIGILFFIRRKKSNIRREETLRQQLLRTQMNPHFLFNALGSIQNFMYKNESKKAATYLNNFASLTRSVLEHSDKELIPLSGELETLENYLELEQMRANSNFEYHINYNEELDTEFTFIPPMFIQPFVENAIKHGFKNIEYKGLLFIDFFEENNFLNIEISDNGCGIKNAGKEQKSHTSKSMQIFEERKSLLARRLKKDIYFTIKDRNEAGSNESGTLVTIKLPISR